MRVEQNKLSFIAPLPLACLEQHCLLNSRSWFSCPKEKIHHPLPFCWELALAIRLYFVKFKLRRMALPCVYLMFIGPCIIVIAEE